MIYSVQYLRGIAALLIVMFHFRGAINDVFVQKNLGDILFWPGVSGVDLFFMISGFIIITSTRNGAANSPIAFLVKRIFRVYPLLILAVLAYQLTWWDFETMPDNPTLIRMVKGMLALNLDYNLPAPYFGYNFLYPAWTISYEVFFYGVFAVALSISHRWRGWIASAMILVMVFGLQLHYNGDWSLNADAGLQVVTSRTVTGIIKLAGSPLLLEFIVGMLLAGIYHSVPSGIHLPKDHWLRHASVAVCWIGGALYAALYFGPIGNFHGPSGFGMWALVAFVPALFYEKLNAVTPNKALMFLGEISYSLYMSHIIVMTFFEMHYQRYFPAFPQVIGISRFVLLTLVSIVVAYLVHVAVEKPAMNIARRLLAAGRRKDTQRGKEIAA